MDILILLFFIICCILLVISLLKKQKIEKINYEIQEENKKLYKEKEDTEKEIKFLKEKEEEENNRLKQIKDMTKDMDNAARQAFLDYAQSLDESYNQKEKDYDDLIDILQKAYDNKQDELNNKIKNVQSDLEKIMATRTAAIEAERKEQEIKDKQSFYCPQVAENDLKDAKILRDIEYKLNNPRILRMLIWSTFYQKPMNQVCANVLGGANAVKTGVYKITNQLNNVCYIGQAVDIATRWKNHAKCGLGIDTPANNNMYKAMQKDGLENFSFEVLEECPSAQLNEKERFYIKLYQADQFGYNSNSGIK